MTKPISKSKRQLAQLLIEAGVTQFPEGANWATQDKRSMNVYCYENKPRRPLNWQVWHHDGRVVSGGELQAATLIPNWHQTVLSRDEFDQIVAADKLPKHDANCRCVTHSIPEPTTAPTLDQLLQDWCSADDYAQRKQTEADEAAAMRDERWQAVQARAGEMNVTVGRCEPVVTESELVITDWRDLKVGDEIKVTGFGGDTAPGDRGLQLLNAISCTVVAADGVDVQIERTDASAGCRNGWYLNGFLKTQWRFIRRP